MLVQLRFLVQAVIGRGVHSATCNVKHKIYSGLRCPLGVRSRHRRIWRRVDQYTAYAKRKSV